MKYLILLSLVWLSGCATTKPVKTVSRISSRVPAHSRVVRTTAYSHQEDGNRSNGMGGRLSCGKVYSAAADWSRFPAGTLFRMVENGRVYRVDDYGSALVGTNTIDLYVPSLREMNNWGVRHVQIEVLEMGSFARSLATLRPRSHRGYIRRMVRDLEGKI